MKGIVKFVAPKRNYGFLIYSSNGSEVLDRDLFFLASEMRGDLSAAQPVTFEMGVSPTDGREIALEVAPVEAPRYRGRIAEFSRRCLSGSIEIEGENEWISFMVSDIFPDVLGRELMPIGSEVTFAIVKKEGRDYAVDIYNEDLSLAEIDVEAYQEWGRVTFWDGDRGHVRRPNGDSLAFLAKNIVTDGVDEIKVGVTQLLYRVVSHRNLFNDKLRTFYHRCYAADIQVGISNTESPEPGSLEEHFMLSAELPEELPVEAPAVQRNPSEIYSAAEKKMSLRALIARKRIAA